MIKIYFDFNNLQTNFTFITTVSASITIENLNVIKTIIV